MTEKHYRPDIDGLRAVAVMAVVLYHAGWTGLSGGFLGVDIFFVISGYLITSIIVREVGDGRFSMVDFWERRARRILPALFAVIAGTLIAGAVILMPYDFAELGKATAAQSVFGSNILFLLQGGYFDIDDQVKPLLHTWSLAVEEQFYLLFPIGVAIYAHFFGPKYIWLFLPVAVLSLALCLVMSHLSTRVAFYALPFRGWELLAGALLAIAPTQNTIRPWQREVISLIGFAMVCGSLFLFTPFMMHPGAGTIVPVAGTVLLIGARGKVTSGLLSWKPLVFTGLVSYSLYLWHWPVLVYARYLPLWNDGFMVAAICIGLSFLLSIATWRYIEQPVRKREYLPGRKSLFLFSLSGLVLLAVAGGVIIFLRGMPARFDPAVAAYAMGANDANPYRGECDQPSLDRVRNSTVCQTNAGKGGAPSFLLWGDSYADSIAPAFYELSREKNENGYVITGHGCPPVLNAHLSMPFRRFDCMQSNSAVIDLVAREKISKVFLVSNWDTYLLEGSLHFPDHTWNDGRYERFDHIGLAALQHTIDTLQEYGAEVYVIINTPYTEFDPPRKLALAERFRLPEPVVAMNDYQKSIDSGIGMFRLQSPDTDMVYIEPQDVLCRSGECRLAMDGKSLFFNPGHLSVHGALSMKGIIARHIE